MSLTGSIVILVVIIARAMMKKVPKKYVYFLWAIAGFRLLCPVSFESKLSIFNIRPLRQSVETVKDLPLITYGSGHGAGAANAANAAGNVADSVSAGTGALQSGTNLIPVILTIVWAVIAVGIICYVIRQYFVMRRELRDVNEVSSGIYAGHQIDSPFVMGVVNPKIYLPKGLTDKELSYMIIHERTHIRRGDVFFKIIGIMILALHWFNPLVWIAYALFVQDMEMSCDEAVIAKLGESIKADYSMSLVSLATRSNAPKYIVVPVAFSKALFGRKEVKMRIKNVLGYNGTTKLISTLSLVLVAAVGLVCLFNATSFADTDYDDGVGAGAEEAFVEETGVADGESVAGDVDVVLDDDGAEVDGEGEATVTIDDETGLPVDVIVDGSSDDDFEAPADGMTADEAAQAAAAAAASSSAASSSASVGYNENNIFGKRLPVVEGIPVDATLNLPAGTIATDGDELECYIEVGKALAGDSFCEFYAYAPGDSVIYDFISALENCGFTNVEKFGDGDCYTVIGATADGINVMVERAGDYFRISYFIEGVENETTVNAFAHVG